MLVKALLNQQDKFGRVYLVNDVFEIDVKDFDPKRHSEAVSTKTKATKGRGKASNKTKPNGEGEDV